MKESCLCPKFAALSVQQAAWLAKLHTQYLTAKDGGSEHASQFMKMWERHFEMTINGAQTTEALEQLKEVPTPNSLRQKLDGKLSLFKRVQAKAAQAAARQNGARTDDPLPA